MKIVAPLMLLLLASCNGSHGNKSNLASFIDDDPALTNDEIESPGVPDEALHWDTQITMVNFNAEQEAKINKAVELIKKVIASEEFKDRVLNFTYNGQRAFVDNRGLTNEQIYKKILEGSESMNPGNNYRMDVELELYYQATTTIGYTYPNTTRIWMNTKYFNNYTPVSVSDNLMHEWMHKLGFDHAASYSPSRDFSVPYGIGYLVEELAAQYY